MKPLHRILLTICLLVSHLPFSLAEGNKTLDSLLFEVQKPMHDTVQFELLLQIGDLYSINNPDTAMGYYNRAKALVENNLEKSTPLDRKFLKQKAKAIRYIGYIYLNQGDYTTALEKYFEALKIGESVNCYNNIYNSYNNIGIINHLRKDYKVAEEYYNKAIAITEKTGNKTGRAKLYINMGVLNYDLGNATDSIGSRLKYYQVALENYTNALKLKKELNDSWGQSLCYNDLGNLKRDGALLINDDNQKERLFKQAGDFYRQSINISFDLNDKMQLSKVYGNFSELYLMMNSLSNISHAEKKMYADSALLYGKESYRLAKELNSISQQNSSTLYIKNAYTLIGDTKKALEYANFHIRSSEELFSEEKTKSLDEMRIRYETEKKDNEITLLNKENELKEIRIKNAARERAFYIAFALSFLSLSVLLLLLYQNRRRTNLLLEEKNKELKVLNSTKDKFISILAHDLKNPFSAFLNISTALNNDFDEIDNDNKKKYINKLHLAVLQLNNLLKNMLEWAVIQHKSTSVDLENLNLFEIADFINHTLSTFALENNVKIENAIPKDLYVFANRAYLITILNNLTTNAIKFSKNGNSVVLTSIIESNQAKIIVEDKGIGIDSTDLDKLFRIDVDTHTIGKSERKGTGMGLILCKELIEKMKGTIRVESKKGEGSRFVLTLPLSPESIKITA